MKIVNGDMYKILIEFNIPSEKQGSITMKCVVTEQAWTEKLKD